jgi:hypothetical protein
MAGYMVIGKLIFIPIIPESGNCEEEQSLRFYTSWPDRVGIIIPERLDDVVTMDTDESKYELLNQTSASIVSILEIFRKYVKILKSKFILFCLNMKIPKNKHIPIGKMKKSHFLINLVNL